MPNQRDQSVTSKRCRTCLQEKPSQNFLSDPKCSDGMKKQCKDCYRRQSRNYCRTHKKSKAAYHRRRMRNPAFRKSRNDYAKRQYQKHKARHNARTKLGYAIKSGKIQKQPCEVCQSTHSQAHHDDYSQPLVVRWLCKLHHAQHHRQYT